MTIEYFRDIYQVLGQYTGSAIATYTVAFLILAISAVLAKSVNFFFSEVLFKLAVRHSSEEENHIVAILNAPLFYSVILFGVNQSLSYIRILDDYSLVLAALLKSIAIVMWASALSQIARIVIAELGHRAENSRLRTQHEMFPLFKNLVSLVVWFAGAALLLKAWNLDITPLLASAGIVGIAVAFAAQDTISHLFGGLSIYFDKPFRVGDRVQLDSGEIGDVLEIGIRSTRIKTFDETVVIIPNNIVASSRIINYNKPKSKIKVKIEVSLAYGTDVQRAKRVILEVVEATPGVEKDPAPSVYFTEMGDFALKFLIVAWAANPKKQFEVRTLLTERLYERILKEKFIIPYPTQELLLRKSK
jgi:small-conductance mechanosensitive channel